MDATSAYDSDKLIAASELEGWSLGYIGIPWPGPWPKRNGDLFVADPIGRQAGIAWQDSGPDFLQITGPTPGRWGVFQLRFQFPVMSEADLVRNFHAVLPALKERRAALDMGGE
ncbi:hypothetical protein [Roseateles sp. P5_E11]